MKRIFIVLQTTDSQLTSEIRKLNGKMQPRNFLCNDDSWRKSCWFRSQKQTKTKQKHHVVFRCTCEADIPKHSPWPCTGWIFGFLPILDIWVVSQEGSVPTVEPGVPYTRESLPFCRLGISQNPVPPISNWWPPRSTSAWKEGCPGHGCLGLEGQAGEGRWLGCHVSTEEGCESQHLQSQNGSCFPNILF